MSKVVSLADERIYLFALEGNLKEVRKHIIGGGNVLASHPIHNGDTALHAACANGHLDVCKYLCSVGANEHHGNDKGNVPLHYAVKNGHLKIVTHLIYSKSASVNARNKYGTTALHFASSKRTSNDIVKFLLKNKADVNIQDSYKGGTPLHWACEYGAVINVVTLLKASNLDIKLLNKKKENVLMTAAKHGFHYICQLLLIGEGQIIKNGPRPTKKKSASSSSKPKRRKSFFSRQRVEDSSSSEEEFDYDELDGDDDSDDYDNKYNKKRNNNNNQDMERYVNPETNDDNNLQLPLVEQKNHNGETLLYVASHHGFEDVISIVLNCMKGQKLVKGKDGYDAIVKDNSLKAYSRSTIASMINYTIEANGKTAVLIAAWRGHISILDKLLKEGGDANIVDKKGRTALHLAAEKGHGNIIKRLIVSGSIDLDTRDHEGSTALHKAAVFGNEKIARFLVNAKVNVNILNNDGRTALYNSALCNRGAIAQFLIENGANVNLATPAGNTPLHKTAYSGDAMTMLKLIGKGADIFAKNRQGIAPLDIAEKRRHRACFDILNELTFKRMKSPPPKDILDVYTRSYSPPPPGSPKTFHLSPPVSPDGVYHRSDSPKGRRHIKEEQRRRLKLTGSNIVSGDLFGGNNKKKGLEERRSPRIVV